MFTSTLHGRTAGSRRNKRAGPLGWTFIRSYVIRDGHLLLSLMADGGIYEFEPRGGARYEGDAVRFWEAPGEATVWWSGAELTCRPR